MTEPVVVQKVPYATEIETGRRYWWCACGRSQNQPFCDGSHKVTDIVPMAYEATETKTVYFCGCKQSSGKPHSKL